MQPVDLELLALASDLPGMKPSLQKRSRKTTVALLAAGAALLQRRTFESLSIEELCASVGVTVGAFYSRFESKQAYFHALQLVAAQRGMARVRRLGPDGEGSGGDLRTLCRTIVGAVVDWFAENEGVARASLQHASTHPDRWGIFKELGRELTDVSTRPLLACMGEGRRAEMQRAIGFAYQMMFGTLINAVLNDPGPCRLRDPDMRARLGRLFVAILEDAGGALPARAKAPPARKPKRRARLRPL